MNESSLEANFTSIEIVIPAVTMSSGLDEAFNKTAFCSSLSPSHPHQSNETGLCSAFDYVDETRTSLDVFFGIYCASLVFFMQAGFAILCAGSIRSKNVKNIILKNILDACGGALGFWSVGYAFAYGGQDPAVKAFIGNSGFFLEGITSGEEYTSFFFQFAFAATAATIVAGSVAERCKFEAYICYSLMLTMFVYPIVVHSVWNPSGFLSPYNHDPAFGVGMLDFAGSGVVHITGGMTALIAARTLGPRIGRFYDSNGQTLPEPVSFPPHSVPFQCIGVMILWFGWYGFNPGSVLQISNATSASVAGLAAVNTTLSAAGACVSSFVFQNYLDRRSTGESLYDIAISMNGALSGLVAITAGCPIVEPWAAVVIGFAAGLIYIGWSQFLARKLLVDDAVDAIPVHLGNGLWGCIAVGFFASPSRTLLAYGQDKHVGWFYSWSRGSGDCHLLLAQICGVLWIVGFVSILMIPFFILLKKFRRLRVDTLEEEFGLDISFCTVF